MAQYKRIQKPQHLQDHTPSWSEAIPCMLPIGSCVFDQRHFVYDTIDGCYPFALTCGMGRQFLELRSEICGTVTTVQKDTLVWIEHKKE